MFRRIELINERNTQWDSGNERKCPSDYHGNDIDGCYCYISKQGIMGVSTHEVAEAWISDLRGPDRSIPWNARFYFTEKGWDAVGRKVIAACMKTNQRYRVIRIKENAVHVVWRDKHTGYEVAVQPLKEKR